jgi:hypothetical protein
MTGDNLGESAFFSAEEDEDQNGGDNDDYEHFALAK